MAPSIWRHPFTSEWTAPPSIGSTAGAMWDGVTAGASLEATIVSQQRCDVTDPHTRYMIRVRICPPWKAAHDHRATEFIIGRRYREFYQLHSFVSRLVRQRHGNATQPPPMPDQGTIFVSRWKESTLRRRKQHFNELLRYISGTPGLHDCADILLFFGALHVPRTEM